jgi:2-polyprenyl-3-methyl-5-hydroxy-6-metoxy-1,4-benzoquinol methylase
VYTGYHTRGPSDGEGSFRADVAKAVAARSFGYRLHATAWRIRAAAAFAGLVPALRRKAQPAFPPIRAWKPPPYRVLDVGCGNGGFLDAMRRIGWTVEGQEWDARAAEAARARGLTVHTEPLERLDVRADLVTMHHVLEHVPDPVTFLDAARRLLEPGGFVYVTTPNLASRGHSIYGKAWRGLEPPRHLHLFTNDSLERTARAAGYVRAEVMPRPDEDRLILESSQRLAKLISSPPTTQPRSAGASEHEVIALVAQNPVG